MHENGADLRFIQQMLGHASVETTAIYTEVAINQLKDVHRRTLPSAKRPGDKTGESGGLDNSNKEE